MKRVALYTRISTADQRSENQVSELAGFAKTQGWSVALKFEDVASGSKSDRRAFQALMAAAAQRKFDLVLFWSLDRFSREGVAQTLKYLQLLESWGVGFRSFTEPYLDSLGHFKDVVLALLATIAKQERIRISERTKAGLASARLRGHIGGRPRLQEDTRKRVLQLRKAGLSYPKIAATLEISTGSAFAYANPSAHTVRKTRTKKTHSSL
jgi:DNA invertase Pin-like site-specific DNA recombinase